MPLTSIPTLSDTAVTLAFAGAGVVMLALLAWVLVLQRRVSRLTAGRTGESLEQTISDLHRDSQTLFSTTRELDRAIKNVDTRLGTGVRAVETIRFNPFRGDGSGGNQSFATAFLDERGNGVVLLCLHTRERVNTYAKPVSQFDSQHELTQEERDAIDRARSRLDTTSVIR